MPDCKSFNFALSIRRSHNYRDGFSHLDEWHLVGEARILRRFESDEECQDMSELPGVILELETRRIGGATKADIRDAILGEFQGSDCTHDWDCCGCIYTHIERVIALNRKGTHWLVIQSRSRNY